MYWRPRRVSRTALLLISIASAGGFVALEHFQRTVKQPYYQEKMAAARLAQSAFKAIREERLRRNILIDAESDPAQTGLVGQLMTPVTTNPGDLLAKQTAVNPNFAAVIVHFLRKAGVSKGDVVAVGYSGSFPAMNAAVLAAMETLKLKPLIITSAASSQFGANDPEFLWLDMEQVLYEAHLISFRSIAASIGGVEDRGLGMTKRGQRLLTEAIAKHNLPMIDPKTFADSIERRMAIYRERAADAPIKAYINIGGGTTSVGRKLGKKTFKPGLNRTAPAGVTGIDSIMVRFIEEGVPIIHLVQVVALANEFGLAVQPKVTPPVGQGKIFFREEPNLWLAGGLLLVILGSLYTFVRSDLGFRIVQGSVRRKDQRGHPEPMV